MLCTSEQVSAGHPDKICDQISDAIVTDCLRHDKNSRVAAECLIKDYEIIIAGEITSAHRPDFKALARGVLRRIGLPGVDQYRVTALISQQSPDIALGVDADGAGDQGMMFGYATDETPQMLPIPYVLACDALERLAGLKSPLLLPDAKCQVTYDYDRERIDTFLISTQHIADADLKDVREAVRSVMEQTAQAHRLNADFRVLINPTGRFVTGGSFADTGLTGRKIIADTYGGMCRHGGGAFSGKDPTKVDRSGAYMARYIAKNLVAAGLADACQLQLAYAIGVAHPVSVLVETYGTGKIADDKLAQLVRECFDLRPAAIIKTLDLRRPIYRQTAGYGHFGRAELDLPWEKTDMVQTLLAKA